MRFSNRHVIAALAVGSAAGALTLSGLAAAAPRGDDGGNRKGDDVEHQWDKGCRADDHDGGDHGGGHGWWTDDDEDGHGYREASFGQNGNRDGGDGRDNDHGDRDRDRDHGGKGDKGGKGDEGDCQLVVTKTADLRWKRVTSWDVAKSASGNAYALGDGKSATVTWSVDVTKTTVDDYYLVAGSIQVENPNRFTVPGVSLQESLGKADLECTVDKGKAVELPVDLPAGATLDCSYAAPVDANEGGVNTVTVTSGMKGIGGSASDAWEALEEPNAGNHNASVTVVDDRLGKSWTAASSEDDAAFDEELPCRDATVVNGVSLLGDDLSTEAVETDHVLATASATVTTTCRTTTPPVKQEPAVEPTPQPASVAAPLVPPTPKAKKPVVKPKPVAKPVEVKAKPKAKKRPVAKAKPVVKGKVAACVAVQVSARTVASGRRSVVTFVATAAGKPVAGARIRLAGPGILKTVRTGAAGRVATAIRPSQSGVIEAHAVGGVSCSGKRIGVVTPAVEPPVTG